MKVSRLIVLYFIFLSCDPVDDRLTIVNKTDETIFFEISDSDSIKNNPVKINDQGDTLWDYMSFVHGNEEAKQPLIGKRRWERFINQNSRDSTLRVFIFDKDQLKSSTDSTVARQSYSQKYSYKVKDLEKLNWRIEYKK